MIIQRFYLSCLAHASYVVADDTSKRALVIDPQRDVEPYREFAQSQGFTITDVVLTHFHADFVAGHLALRDAVGATVHLGHKAQAEFAFHPLADGDVIDLGQVRLTVMETPGHTPESISLLASSNTGPLSQAVFTGDTLFIGDVGRPDLMASVGVTADSLAKMLFLSIRKLATLSDATIVYPAHGAGSMCGKNLGTEASSTIGQEKRTNYALAIHDQDEFVRVVTADQPEAPAYFSHDAALNKREHDTHIPMSVSLTVTQVIAAMADGVQLVDVRDATAFAGAHLHGAINIGLRGQFAMWAGAVLNPQREIVLVAEPSFVDEAITRLRRIGCDRIRGHLDGGMAALAAYPQLVESSSRIDAGKLNDWRKRSEHPLIVDVRRKDEYQNGHIPGSRNIPLQSLVKELGSVPFERDLVVHCAGGYRSAIAASVLAANGFQVADLIGGYNAWKGVVV